MLFFRIKNYFFMRCDIDKQPTPPLLLIHEISKRRQVFFFCFCPKQVGFYTKTQVTVVKNISNNFFFFWNKRTNWQREFTLKEHQIPKVHLYNSFPLLKGPQFCEKRIFFLTLWLVMDPYNHIMSLVCVGEKMIDLIIYSFNVCE